MSKKWIQLIRDTFQESTPRKLDNTIYKMTSELKRQQRKDGNKSMFWKISFSITSVCIVMIIFVYQYKRPRSVENIAIIENVELLENYEMLASAQELTEEEFDYIVYDDLSKDET